jgi:hypothetical protein
MMGPPGHRYQDSPDAEPISGWRHQPRSQPVIVRQVGDGPDEPDEHGRHQRADDADHDRHKREDDKPGIGGEVSQPVGRRHCGARPLGVPSGTRRYLYG